MKKVVSMWLLLVVFASCVFGVMHLVVQQNIRGGANDPQIQIAEDLVQSFDNGRQMTFSQRSIDVAQSLAPFIMVFDTNGNVKSSEAMLHGKTPNVPKGVFASVAKNGESRFTWQPEDGVRIAAVVAKYNSGYVLAGRNIREVEKREDNLLQQIVFGWLVTAGVSLAAAFILVRKK